MAHTSDDDVFGNYSDSRVHKHGSWATCSNPAFHHEELAHWSCLEMYKCLATERGRRGCWSHSIIISFF